MAHPEMEASTDANPGSIEDQILDLAGVEEEEAEEGDLPLEDELEAEEAESIPEEDGEQEETPAIDPPVSWGTDAKELFAQLSPEIQQQVVEREAQREKFLQAKAVEAAEAKRSARIEAENLYAEQQRQYASEIEFFASRVLPQPPDPSLANTDPVGFIQMNAQYQAALAQHQQMMQRANEARTQAEQRDNYIAQQQVEADMAILAQQIPEWNDAAKRNAFLSEITKLGEDLGYPAEVLREANAQDVLALRTTMDWKAKAAKWDALQKTKMEKVRGAKQLPKVVRPGVAPTRGEISSNRSNTAWQNVKTAKNKDAQADAFATFLETSGHI